MNRSFRAQESQMQAAFKQRQQQMGVLRSSVMKEKDEELALFLEMRRREKERSDLLLHSSEELDAPLGSSMFKTFSLQFFFAYNLTEISMRAKFMEFSKTVKMLVLFVKCSLVSFIL